MVPKRPISDLNVARTQFRRLIMIVARNGLYLPFLAAIIKQLGVAWLHRQ